MKSALILLAAPLLVAASPYACGDNLEYNPDSSAETNLTSANCCREIPDNCRTNTSVSCPDNKFVRDREITSTVGDLAGFCCFFKLCKNVDGDNGKFKCPDTAYYNKVNAMTMASEGECCVPKTCMNDGAPLKSYTCPNTKEYNTSASSLEATEDNCCKPKPCGNTAKNGPTKGFPCPSGKIHSSFTGNDVEDLEGSVENCCQDFVSMCAFVNEYKDELDLFGCAEGTTLNPKNMFSTDPSQEKCCESFVPTCEFDSGSVVDRVPYPCPNFKKFNFDAMELSASETNCCVDHTPTCEDTDGQMKQFECTAPKVFNDDARELNASETNCCIDRLSNCGNTDGNGKIWECKAGSVFNENHDLVLTNEDACCKAPTCGSATQPTCASVKETQTCDSKEEADSTKDTLQLRSQKDYSRRCCKPKSESPDPTFTMPVPLPSASTMLTAGAASGLMALVALLF